MIALSRLMHVRWTTDAADDLERICDYIARTVHPHDESPNPWSSASAPWKLPALGRVGRVHGTREIAFPPFLRRSLRASRGTEIVANSARSAAVAMMGAIVKTRELSLYPFLSNVAARWSEVTPPCVRGGHSHASRIAITRTVATMMSRVHLRGLRRRVSLSNEAYAFSYWELPRLQRWDFWPQIHAAYSTWRPE